MKKVLTIMFGISLFLTLNNVEVSAYTKEFDECLTCGYVEPTTDPSDGDHDETSTDSSSTPGGSTGGSNSGISPAPVSTGGFSGIVEDGISDWGEEVYTSK